MRIVYMGTPDFAVLPLRTLFHAGHEVLAVVSQPDRRQGRHMELVPTAVKKEAMALDPAIPVLQPEKASDPAFIDTLRAMAPDAIVVAAYGKILKKALLDIPRLGCINIHGSLLPRWRGAAPIQWTVISGDRYGGITTMKMNEGLDTGDILLQRRVELDPQETGGSLFEKLSVMGADLIAETLKALEEGSVEPLPQPEEGSTYAPMLSRNDGRLDWNRPAEELERLIRGLDPWPGCYTLAKEKMLKIRRAAVREEEPCVPELPGSVFLTDRQELLVRCGRGVLCLLELQLEGKKSMRAQEFIRGNLSALPEVFPSV